MSDLTETPDVTKTSFRHFLQAIIYFSNLKCHQSEKQYIACKNKNKLQLMLKCECISIGTKKMRQDDKDQNT
jgi:hypothetical protein